MATAQTEAAGPPALPGKRILLPWAKWIVLGALLAAATVYLQIRWLSVTWMGDDGYFFVGAQRLLRGETIYRDFTIYITPGTYYFLAVVLKVFGESWETTRLLWLLVTLVQGAGVYLIVHRLTKSEMVGAIGFALVTAWAILNPVFLHLHLSAALALGSTWAWWRWLETRSSRFALLAGISDGLVGFTSQNKGFYLLCASVAVILLLSEPGWKTRCRTLLVYGLGGGTVALLFGASLWWQGSVSGFYRDAVLWVLGSYTKGSYVPYGTSLGFIDSRMGFEHLANLAVGLWIAACAPISAAVEAGLAISARRCRPFPMLLALQGIALWASALHRPDLLDHLRLSAHLSTALLLVQVHELSALREGTPGRLRKAGGWAASFVLVALGASCASVVDGLARQGMGEDHVPLPSIGPRTWTPFARLAQTVEGLSHHLETRTPPDEPIFVLPHSSLYYVALHRRNATKYEFPAEAPGMEVQIEELILQLDRRKVRTVIVDENWIEQFERMLYPRLKTGFLKGRLMEYVQREYVMDARFPRATVYRRKA